MKIRVRFVLPGDTPTKCVRVLHFECFTHLATTLATNADFPVPASPLITKIGTASSLVSLTVISALFGRGAIKLSDAFTNVLRTTTLIFLSEEAKHTTHHRSIYLYVSAFASPAFLITTNHEANARCAVMSSYLGPLICCMRLPLHLLFARHLKQRKLKSISSKSNR